MKHTPTPWTAHNRLKTTMPASMLITAENGEIGVARVLDNGKQTEANAAFIVTACNAHAALVEAAQLALIMLEAHSLDLLPNGKPCHAAATIKKALDLAGAPRD